MRASQVAHTSTEICNWSTDPSVRNILTVEVRTDTSCTDELLGSSCGDFTIWSSTLEVPYAFQRWRNKLFASGFNGRLLPTSVGYPGLQMWWLGSHHLSLRKVAASDWARTCNLRLGDWRSSLCRYGGFPWFFCLFFPKCVDFSTEILRISRNFCWCFVPHKNSSTIFQNLSSH